MSAGARRSRSPRTRRGFWFEAVAAGLSAVLALLTVATRRWIEVLLGVEHGGSAGSVEWLLVRALATAALVLALLARDEWHRTSPA